jgi:5-amino-6-(5-phosphoribosylamino)uracil reductase
VPERPYTVLSCSISIDGYLDDGTSERLVLSNDADLDRVDAVRASSDAILVGASTVRRDNPRLEVRSEQRRAARMARGLSATPIKVTVTATGRLDAGCAFFANGAPSLVYSTTSAAAEVRTSVGRLATVIDAGERVDLGWLSEDLHGRGVRRLMVEGGGHTLTQFLTAGLADELHLVVAPLFVGDSRGSRLVDDGRFPWNAQSRATLAEVVKIGDVVLLRYALSARFTLD